ncbi:MAG: HlyD family efflux transporter periplasmic adaptor subunit, partial [Treponema sp.]|nr:HlyD family efflux transporter periplasmic adaptor subunit [Treponema sp.]
TITEADIREMESQIRQMQDTLKKFEIKASCDGIVISLNYNLGSMVNPGYNIADISAANEKYVVCYVPVDTSEQISYNDSFFVRANKKECRGEVRFIDVKSQYTPKDMQTSANKNKVSVKVKLLLPPETDFKPGSFVDVVIKQ